MSDIKVLIIFLSQYDLTNSKIDQILKELGSNPTLQTFKKTKLWKNGILTQENYENMLAQADEKIVKTYVLNLENRGIKITTKFDEDFPTKLFNLPDCPHILYYMGDMSLAKLPSLSVVGSRKPTNYGRMATERIVRDVASAGIVIVSGLAYGVDSIAHRKCLEVGGKTIAVLGGGFDHIYPTEHQDLAMEIARKGLLISEYRPKRQTTKYSFPQRNRIVAGLGDGVLITEATIKSGTIHTKEFALEYGKNIYSVPGNIDSATSELTNEIIKRGQAACVTKADDILKDYDVKNESSKGLDIIVSEDEKKILKLLASGSKNIDELTKESGLSINIFNTCLTTLEISGIIKRLPGGNIALN